jgi:hypothetical protein
MANLLRNSEIPKRGLRLYGAANARFAELQTTFADEVAFWMNFRERYVPPARERMGATASEGFEGEGRAMGWQKALVAAFELAASKD